MAQSAHIESLDALKRFRVALVRFAESVGIGLDEADAEVQRTEMWLKQEQPAHWKHQVSVRTELYTRAKSALARKKLQTSGLNNRPSCVDELKALAAAERALEEARHKQAEVRRWSRLFEQEAFNYAGAVQRLRTATQGGLPRALAHLDAMIEAIEAYGDTPEIQRQRSEIVESSVAAFEDETPMSRSVPPGEPSTPDYAHLRARTPTQDERDALAIQPASDVWKTSAESSPRTAASRMSSERFPIPVESAAPSREDRLVLDARVAGEGRLYLERSRGPCAGDSGWFVGVVDVNEGTPPRHVAIRVHEALARWPFLETVVGLPPGWLVVLRDGAPEAVLDSDDRLRFVPDEPGAVHRGARGTVDAPETGGQ